MADFRWRWPSQSVIYRNIVRKVPGVGLSTFAEAGRIGARARAIHAVHSAHNAPRRAVDGTQASYISVDRGALRVDSFVNLHDPDNRAGYIEVKTNVLRGSLFG